MDRIGRLLRQLQEPSSLSAAVTVIAMLLAGVLAKLDGARWGLYVVAALCLLHIAAILYRQTARPGPEPGQ